MRNHPQRQYSWNDRIGPWIRYRLILAGCLLGMLPSGCSTERDTASDPLITTESPGPAQETPDAGASRKTAASGKAAREFLEETWDAIYVEDKKVGHGHKTLERVVEDDRELLKIVSEFEVAISRSGQTTTMQLSLTSYETPEHDLVRLRSEQSSGPTAKLTTGRVQDGRLSLEIKSQGKTQRSSIDWPERVGGFFAIDQSLRNKPMKPGETRTIRFFAPTFDQVSDTRLEAIDYEATPMLAGTRELLKVKGTTEFPGPRGVTEIEEVRWVDRSGRTVKTFSPLVGLTSYRSTKEVALGKTEVFDLVEVSVVRGHRRMLKLLEDIKSRAAREHLYFGKEVHIRMREKLAQFGKSFDKLQRAEHLGNQGRAELYYEKTPELAIEHLTECLQLIEELKEEGETIPMWWVCDKKFQLAVAWLRLGETENCCLRYNAQSCILPIRGGGLHSQERGSRSAIRYFTEVLRDTEGITDRRLIVDVREPARWLMNIAYMTLGEYPDQVPKEFLIPTEFFESEIEFPRFENVAPKLNLNTLNAAGGAVVDDFDNDDYLDIFVSTADPTLPCRFFHNNRDGTFTDLSDDAGLTGLYGGLNVVQADYNNDGNLDVLILRGAWLGAAGRHPNSLLRNNGNLTFTDVTFQAGLGEVHYPTKTASWADYDNDGDLDLFIGNEASDGFEIPSQLFRNNGDETFTDVTAAAGVGDSRFTMAVVWGDYDNDRYPDLFSCGDYSDQHGLYHNNQNGTFTNVAEAMNVTEPGYGWASWFWDFNNDGALDLYVGSSTGTVATESFASYSPIVARSHEDGVVTLNIGSTGAGAPPMEIKFKPPALYRGDGKGGFVYEAIERKITYATNPMGANFGDVNGDGWLDFYLATGDVLYSELRPNVMYVSQAGERFANVTMAGGFGHLQKGHGVSFADIDNDGDQDVYVQTGGQLPGDRFNDALFENPGFNHHWITVKLTGRQSNRCAIGARIHVRILEEGRQRSIFRYVNSGGSFGCNPLRKNIGLGKAERIESIEVYWPTSDLTQTFSDVPLDQSIEIVEGDKRYRSIQLKQFTIGGG
jgi:hypothetical protein